jgi:(2Fe-2S) ferredoxin
MFRNSIQNISERATGLLRKLSFASLPQQPPAEPKSGCQTHIHFSEACFTCEATCSVHPQLPETMQKRIEQSTLYNTFKPYRHHIIIPGGTGETWADHIEEHDGPVKSIQSITQESKQGRIMVTGYETTEPNPGYFVFPQGLQLFPQSTQLEALASWVVENSDSTPPTDHALIDSKAIVFVCNHKKRDKRCGVAGPMLIDQFNKELEEAKLSSSVKVYGISHIGGHKFAGNIIIYRKDDRNVFVGDWYGRVKTCHVSTIIEECIKNGKVIQELWRGQMNADPNDPGLNW